MADFSAWSRYKPIQVRDARVDQDLNEFPLLVAFNDDPSIGAHARADGFDLRFTLDDGETELFFERETFGIDGQGRASGRFWVRVPQLLGAGGGTAAALRCYYGNPDAPDASDPTAVWGENDFGCVFHFRGGNPAAEYDAVNPARQLTPVGSPIWHSDGPGGAACYEFGNAARRCFYANGWLPALTGNMTLEMFARFAPADIANWRYCHFLGTGNDYQCLATATSQRVRAVVRTPATYELSAYAGMAADEWHHLAATVEDAARHDIYLDGEVVSYNATTRGSLPDATGYAIGAKDSAASGAIDGKLAEVRLSTALRSDAWLKFTWANLAGPDPQYPHELVWGPETRPRAIGFHGAVAGAGFAAGAKAGSFHLSGAMAGRMR